MQERVKIVAAASVALVDWVTSTGLVTKGFRSGEEFSVSSYDFRSRVVELWALAVLRGALLLGCALGLARLGPLAAERMGRARLLFLLIGVASASYSPLKLLALDEEEALLFAAPFHWALVGWNLAAALAALALHYALSTEPKAEAKPKDKAEDKEPLLKAEEEAYTAKSGTLVRRLLAYSRTEWRLYLLGFTALFAYSGARIFIPYYMSDVIAKIVLTKEPEDLNRSIGIMVALSLTSAFFGGVRGGSFKLAMAKVGRKVRGDLFESLSRQDMAFFDMTPTGEMSSRLTADCQTMNDSVGLNVNVFLRNLVMMVGSLAVMTRLSWQMTSVTFVVVPLIGVVSKVYGAYYDRLSEQTQDSIASANKTAEEILGGMRTVRSFAAEEDEVRHYRGRLEAILDIAKRQTVAYTGYVWINETLDLLILTAVLWYGGHLVIGGRLEGKELITFLLYQLQLGENLLVMGQVWTGLMESVGASRKVFRYIDRRPAFSRDGRLAPGPDSFAGELEFRNVSFSYPSRPDQPVIKNLSLKVRAGETVALVGHSGGGKSSIVALLEQFYRPDSGRILVDGVGAEDYDKRRYHQLISLVSQEPVLFARNIRDNVLLGLREGEAGMGVGEALRMANAEEFVRGFSAGEETEVGEKGAQLSGGQKQRVAIARSLVRQPKVLLLDEATSALDGEAEAQVQAAIQGNLNGRTVLLIAHRLSTVRHADRICVLSHGELVEEGSHSALLAKGGLYASLVQRQLLPTSEGEWDAAGPKPPHRSEGPAQPATAKTGRTGSGDGTPRASVSPAVETQSPSTSFRSLSPASSPPNSLNV